MDSAAEDHLAKKKLTTSPYDVQRAHSEFPFINVKFVPLGEANPMEHEGGTGGTCDHTGFVDIPWPNGPNAVILHIPVPLSLCEISSIMPLDFPSAPHKDLISISANESNHILLDTVTSPQLSGSTKLIIKLPARQGNEGIESKPMVSDTHTQGKDGQ